MSRFNSTQADSSQSSPRYAPSFNTGGGALELEVRDAEEHRIALIVTRACEECAAGLKTEDKEDVAQTAAIGLMQRVRDGLVLSDDDLRRYAFTATQHAHRKMYRAEQRRAAHEAQVETPYERETPHWQETSHLAELYTIERVYENVAQYMPAESREAFEMIHFDGLSFTEASERTGVSETALRKRVTRARLYLQPHFRQTTGSRSHRSST